MKRDPHLDHLMSAPRLNAGYDVAKTTNENRKHWANADALAPVSQLTPAVRATLRNRARYEVQNNSFAAGLIRTLVGDTIGTGPRLQMQTDDEKLNAGVEDLFRKWAVAVDLSLKYRLICGVRYVAGECFGKFRTSARLERMRLPVTLDLQLIEPEQVTDGIAGYLFRQTGDDGIVCDDDGEVVGYKILKFHPGDNRAFAVSLQADTYSPDDVVHWFQPERPGQLRGATPLAPGLPIFAQLRRFTSATLTAAEMAAMLAGVMTTTLSPDDTAVRSESLYDTVDLVRGTLLSLPAGWQAQQFKPEQPTTNYKMFVDAKLRECGRMLNVPFGKMAGDHSLYNYSSARMDDGNYWQDRAIERQALEVNVFDRVFYMFCDFAREVLPALSAFAGEWYDLSHCWHYDPRLSIDPVKDASGDELNLTNGSDTLAAIAMRDGTTVETLIAQRKREKELFEEAGLPLPAWMTGGAAPVRTAGDGAPQQQPQGATAHAA